MAKYKISYAYYKIDKNGKPQSKISTNKTIESETESGAMQILQSLYPSHQIEYRKVLLIK